MWGLLGPGLKPVSPALAGGLLTTVPPGKPLHCIFVSSWENRCSQRPIKFILERQAVTWALFPHLVDETVRAPKRPGHSAGGEGSAQVS